MRIVQGILYDNYENTDIYLDLKQEPYSVGVFIEDDFMGINIGYSQNCSDKMLQLKAQMGLLEDEAEKLYAEMIEHMGIEKARYNYLPVFRLDYFFNYLKSRIKERNKQDLISVVCTAIKNYEYVGWLDDIKKEIDKAIKSGCEGANLNELDYNYAFYKFNPDKSGLHCDFSLLATWVRENYIGRLKFSNHYSNKWLFDILNKD